MRQIPVGVGSGRCWWMLGWSASTIWWRRSPSKSARASASARSWLGAASFRPRRSANALAEQHGSFLRTEHGFGTGLRALMGRDSVQESGGTPPEAPPLSPTEPPELSLGDTQAAAVDKSASAKRVEAEPAVSEGPERSVAWTAGPPPAAAPQASWSEQRREGSPEAQGQPRPDLGHLLFVPTWRAPVSVDT